MELLDGLEAMEQCDAVLAQMYFLHSALCAQWARQHRTQRTPLRLPFVWVLSKTLRLLEEYPDGLTEAIVLTELTSQLHRRERQSLERSKAPRLADRLEEADDAVVHATVTAYAQHCIHLRLVESDADDTETTRMFLHQRFRACLAAFASLGAAPPFSPGREIVFTDAKLLEKQTRVAATGTSILPTPYLALRLTPSDGLLHAHALTFAQVDVMASQELPDADAPSLLQELVVQAQVVDISAIRPCTTPYHVQRQVILLTDATASQASGGSHVLILWDDQVALSRLFHVGDTLTLLHPFVHVCAPNDAEIVAVYEEFSSQQRCSYYLEYGSATTLFVTPRKNDLGTPDVNSLQRHDLQPGQDHHAVSVRTVSKHWIGFSLYGNVASIRVSHGIPLLAAFFHAYYDPKTQGRLAGAERPSLDRAVVSKYYLVVLIELYDASSSSLCTLELTGETAVRALALRIGQTVFVEGLVTVDMQSDPIIRALRNEKTDGFAFPNRAYTSPLVALSSDWESLFGHQSDVFTPSRLFAINTIPGVLRTRLPRDRERRYLSELLAKTENVAMVVTQWTVTSVGWLVPVGTPDASSFAWDESCERGFSTMLAHRACKRPLEPAPTQPSNPLPRWKCSFCNEIFAGMDATVQTYCDLTVRIDDGSLGHHTLHAICHGDAVGVLLGVPAEAFAQLSLPAKRSTLRQACGKDYSAVLSRCPPRSITTPRNRFTVDARVDQLQSIDAFATAQALLLQLTERGNSIALF